MLLTGLKARLSTVVSVDQFPLRSPTALGCLVLCLDVSTPAGQGLSITVDFSFSPPPPTYKFSNTSKRYLLTPALSCYFKPCTYRWSDPSVMETLGGVGAVSYLSSLFLHAQNPEREMLHEYAFMKLTNGTHVCLPSAFRPAPLWCFLPLFRLFNRNRCHPFDLNLARSTLF